MKKLLELEKRLKEAQEDLKKYIQWAGEHGGKTKDGKKAEAEAKTPVKKMDGSADMGSADVNMAKEEHCSDEDKKADEKMIEEKLDEHNEEKHGEAKDKDSAMKAEDCKEMLKFGMNGQWSLMGKDESQ